MRPFLIALILLFACRDFAAAQTFRIDPAASRVTAKVPFFAIGSKTAGFPDVSGAASVARQDFAIDVAIDARKLTASDTLTTNRLKGPKFFDVGNYPVVRFVGNRLTMADAVRGNVSGTLTARGVTRPVTLDVTFSRPPFQLASSEPVDFVAATTIDRRDFGMTAYSLIVGRKVSIEIRAKLVR